MRVTSKMMTTNMLSNINKNKNNMSSLADQYSTQQKIQRPSEDPVIAVRSLKYRTSLSELNQYHEKNVPDAMSWMEQTESSLNKVNEILTQMNTYFNQGANDSLEATDRDALLETLREYKSQIYECMNADNAGRFVFTGYRTDVPLLFDQSTDNYEYTIKEPLSFDNVQTKTYVKANIAYDPTKTDPQDYANMAATEETMYRIKLSYSEIDKGNPTLKLTVDGATKNVATISQNDPNAYDIEAVRAAGTDCDALFIAETGELILSKELYADFSTGKEFSTEYKKSSFQKNELRPEHYFDCTVVNKQDGKTYSYTKPTQQKINYEVNFSQSISVNTMANECIDATLGNQIDDVIKQLERVKKVETKLNEIDTMIKNKTYACDEDTINELKAQVENELALEKTALQKTFGNGLTTTTKVQAKVNKVTADLGSRYKRLELTESRLADQISSYTEMLTSNDTVNIEDAIINYTSAMTTYNASLNAAAKVVQNSLLDFL